MAFSITLASLRALRNRPCFCRLMLRLLIRPLLLNARRHLIGSAFGEWYNSRAKVLRIACLMVLLLENGARTSL